MVLFMKKTMKFQKQKALSANKRVFAYFEKTQKGVTLIEVLVALLIFSVGALGLAAMQLTAVAASGDNQQRSVAIWKAQELANRIRSNSALRQQYVNLIGNANTATIGVDSQANVIDCTQIPQPPAICSDAPGGVNAAVCSNVQKVTYDVWDVFCEPSTGAAVIGGAGANANAAGSVGLTNLEVALIDNQVAGAAGPNGNDMLLYFEWVSREADANATGTDNLVNGGQVINTNLCDANFAMAPSLDAYCLRFSPF